jgi:hypothetical protein
MFFTYTETLISAVSSHGMNYKITSYLFFPPSIFLKQRKTTLIFLRLLLTRIKKYIMDVNHHERLSETKSKYSNIVFIADLHLSVTAGS